MRTMIAAGLLAMAPLHAPSLQQTPATPPPATAPAAQPLPAKTAGAMEAPKLPPFAGGVGGVCCREGTPSGAMASRPAAIIVRMDTNPMPRAGER